MDKILKEIEEIGIVQVYKKYKKTNYEQILEIITNDINIMTREIKKDWFSISVASPTIKDNIDIASYVVKQSEYGINHISNNRKNDPKIALLAIETFRSQALPRIGKELKNNDKFMLNLNKFGISYTEILKNSSKELRKDKEYVKKIVKKDASSFKVADKSLRKNKDYIKELIPINTDILNYIEPQIYAKIIKNQDLVSALSLIKEYILNNNDYLDRDQYCQKHKISKDYFNKMYKLVCEEYPIIAQEINKVEENNSIYYLEKIKTAILFSVNQINKINKEEQSSFDLLKYLSLTDMDFKELSVSALNIGMIKEATIIKEYHQKLNKANINLFRIAKKNDFVGHYEIILPNNNIIECTEEDYTNIYNYAQSIGYKPYYYVIQSLLRLYLIGELNISNHLESNIKKR